VTKVKESYLLYKKMERQGCASDTTTLVTLVTLDHFSHLHFYFSIKKGRHLAAALIIILGLSNRGRFAKMFLLHCHASAATANKLHGCQFVLALMGVIRFRSPAETAFGFITAWITQVPRLIGDRPATFTCIGHR
jgi:hypothetical protein